MDCELLEGIKKKGDVQSYKHKKFSGIFVLLKQ